MESIIVRHAEALIAAAAAQILAMVRPTSRDRSWIVIMMSMGRQLRHFGGRIPQTFPHRILTSQRGPLVLCSVRPLAVPCSKKAP